MGSICSRSAHSRYDIHWKSVHEDRICIGARVQSFKVNFAGPTTYRRWRLRHHGRSCGHCQGRRPGRHPARERRRALPASQAGALERNEAIEHISQSSRQGWQKQSGYSRRSLIENLMYRFKTLTGDMLWARNVKVQDAEVAIRVGTINRMLVLACPKSVRPA